MTDDTPNPHAAQPIAPYGVACYLAVLDSGLDEPMRDLPPDSPLLDRALELARMVAALLRENTTLRACIAEHEAADRRMLADLQAAEARAVTAEASVEALMPVAVHSALRTGNVVDIGCSRDSARYSIASGLPLPECDVCGADEDDDCQAGVR